MFLTILLRLISGHLNRRDLPGNLLQLNPLDLFTLHLRLPFLLLLGSLVSLILLDNHLDELSLLHVLLLVDLVPLLYLPVESHLDLPVSLLGFLRLLSFQLFGEFVLLDGILYYLFVHVKLSLIGFLGDIAHSIHDGLDPVKSLLLFELTLSLLLVQSGILLFHQLYLSLELFLLLLLPSLLFDFIISNDLHVDLTLFHLLHNLLFLLSFEIILEFVNLNQLLVPHMVEVLHLFALSLKQHYISLSLLEFDFHSMLLFHFVFFIDLTSGILEHHLVHLLVILFDVLPLLLLLLHLLIKCNLYHLLLAPKPVLFLADFFLVKLKVVLLYLSPLVRVNLIRQALYVISSIFISSLLLTHFQTNIGIILILTEVFILYSFESSIFHQVTISCLFDLRWCKFSLALVYRTLEFR